MSSVLPSTEFSPINIHAIISKLYKHTKKAHTCSSYCPISLLPQFRNTTFRRYLHSWSPVPPLLFTQVHTSLAFAPPLALKLSFAKSPLTSTSHLSSLILTWSPTWHSWSSSFLKCLNLAYKATIFWFSTYLPDHSPSLSFPSFW